MARRLVNFFRLSSSDQALLIQAALAVVNAASFLYAPVAYDELLMSLGENMPRTSMSKTKADDDWTKSSGSRRSIEPDSPRR